MGTATALNTSRDFYPRSPCGERLDKRCKFDRHNRISIHALLAESDPATSRNDKHNMISIHALLAESDHTGQQPAF